MHCKTTIWALVIFMMTLRSYAADPCATTGQSTVLASAATALAEGQWCMMETENVDTLLSNGASGFLFGYTDDLKWDPVSRQVLYTGGDHVYDSSDPNYEAAQFVTYSEADNRWQREPRPYWMGSGTMHGYDHSALDVEGRSYYHRTFGPGDVYRYDLVSGEWSAMPPHKGTCCGGMEYFPELNGLVLADGKNASLFLLEDGAASWSTLDSGISMGVLHNVAEYNPVHGVVLFGGGDFSGGSGTSSSLHKVDSTGAVTAIANAPRGVGIQRSVFTVDPVSGEFLLFAQDQTAHSYDVVADSWFTVPTDAPIWSQQGIRHDGNGVHGVAATPVSTYGVNMIVTCDSGNCRVALYKHSNTDNLPADTAGPAVPTGLSVH